MKTRNELDIIENKAIKLLSARFGRAESWVNLALMHARYDMHLNDQPRGVAKDIEVLMGGIETELWYDRAVVNAGYVRGISQTLGPDKTMTYLSLGYRLDQLTPYVLLHGRSMHFPRQACRRAHRRARCHWACVMTSARRMARASHPGASTRSTG